MKPARLDNAQRIVAIFSLFALAAFGSTPAGAADWPRWSTPEEAGFSSARLDATAALWAEIPASAVGALFVVYKGRQLASYGNETYPFWCHSMRKSFLSALYGIHVKKGNIDLDLTLEELGIDDTTPLTPVERQATVRHLLKARSGIYIEAACESAGMKAERPPRGSHTPDTFWYYNNWDFNALGTIFRQETGRDIFEEFDAKIASPLGMQDFQPGWCRYEYQQELSMHPCYTFRMSPRDRARFGQLFLQNGRWGNRQVIPERWIDESTHPWSVTDLLGGGYGYMWWSLAPRFFEAVFRDSRLHHLSTYYASGYGGQFIFVIPDADMVMVFSVDVPAGGSLTGEEVLRTLESILTAGEIVDLDAHRVKAKGAGVDRGGSLRLSAKVKNRSPGQSNATTVDFYLASDRSFEGDVYWLGAADLAPIAGRRRKTAKLDATTPDDLPPGDYYLAAVVDRDKANYDLKRPNNVLVARRTIEVR
jgi:CubicO group peptidase (beta-lactamase class C family)